MRALYPVRRSTSLERASSRHPRVPCSVRDRVTIIMCKPLASLLQRVLGEVRGRASLVAFSAVAFERIDIAADFRRRAAEQQIVLIESGDLLQPLDMAQGQPMARQRDKVVPAESL